MSIHQLFATPVITNQFRITPQQAKELAAAIRSLSGSYTDEQMPLSPLNQLVPFHASIEEAVLDSFWTIAPEYEWSLCSMKLNTMRPGEMQQIHMHRDVDAFAVFYLNPGPVESGFIRLYDPRFTDHTTIRPQDSCFMVPPSLGTLVAAPSYVWHSVDQHHGHEDRLSVVYNGIAKQKVDD